ncbi:DNA-binding NtrC family response regulator [Azospirillum lipoferum]|uniref:Response regulator n=1 Tax=Azospirillum lipoferum TaxID=193 RepID=A0A5A9GTC2_AZOLI|nr:MULTISPECIES: response regulator [Azospirillum]KAA0597065.1 response regulator [Azospirillum lipoferum]MCP1608555.1 DNA-binding NtrC family response regulator [Azospirillum lipoferum]MDW5536127.1 response regulator [Azospirillum sp. NL1]
MDISATSDRFAVVIDDESIILAGMEIMLDTWGYQVLAAEDVETILAKLPGRPVPSVILSDYRLRDGWSGITAVRAVREAVGMTVPAIILTGDTGAELLTAARTEQISILHKPVQPNDLRRQIDALIAAAA